MKAVLRVAKKSLPSACIYFFIFCGLMLAFSFLSGQDQEKMFKASELDIYVDDRDHSVLSGAITEYLAKENNVTTEFDRELVSELIFNGVVHYVLYIEPGFEEAFLAGEKDGIERLSIRENVAFTDQKLEMFFRYVKAELAVGQNMEDACATVLRNSDLQVKTTVSSGKSALVMEPGYYFLTYLAYIFPAILIIVLGPIMHAFYRKDMKMRLSCGKVSARTQNVHIVAGISVIAVGFWAMLMGIGAVIYGRYFTVTTYLLGMCNTLLYMAVSVAIAVLIGVLVRGKDALNGASNVIAMGMAFMCGIFVPMEFLPDGVVKASEFLPASWYMKNVKLLFAGEDGSVAMAEFFGNCGIIAVFAVAVFSVFLVVGKRKKIA